MVARNRRKLLRCSRRLVRTTDLDASDANSDKSSMTSRRASPVAAEVAKPSESSGSPPPEWRYTAAKRREGGDAAGGDAHL